MPHLCDFPDLKKKFFFNAGKGTNEGGEVAVTVAVEVNSASNLENTHL